MKTKIIIWIVFGLLYSGLTFAQSIERQVIGSTGGSAQSASNQIDYTIGEVVIETFVTNSGTFTQGFHQSRSSAVGIKDVIENDVFNVFPNPTISWINVEFEATQEEKEYLLKIVSLAGVTVKELIVLGSDISTTIDVSDFAASSYLLLIINVDTGKQTHVIFEKIN